MFHSLLQEASKPLLCLVPHSFLPSQIVLRSLNWFYSPGWGSISQYTSKPLYLQTNHLPGCQPGSFTLLVTSHSETLKLSPICSTFLSKYFWYYITLLISLISIFQGCVVRATREVSPPYEFRGGDSLSLRRSGKNQNVDLLTRMQSVEGFLLWNRTSDMCFGWRSVLGCEEESPFHGPVFHLPFCSERGGRGWGAGPENTREELIKDKYSFVCWWCSFIFLS